MLEGAGFKIEAHDFIYLSIKYQKTKQVRGMRDYSYIPMIMTLS